ncbi:MAG: sulfite oxidase [Planctomycetales bacterium]
MPHIPPSGFPLNRRAFLALGSLAFAGSSWRETSLWGADAKPLPKADQFITGKDSRLIVHSAKTGEIETPLTLLREHAVTPKEILFVRNNQLLPGTLTTEPATPDHWTIEVKGLVEGAKPVSIEDLQKLPQREIELVLQCSGNSRSRFAKAVKAEGVPWQHGAMGNVKHSGPLLKDVLAAAGIKLKPEAKYLTAEGKDTPPMAGAADFEHSLPLTDVLEKSILALQMNGEPIPRTHGGPVRLITPGYYATMNVKWVSALRFEAGESTNYNHEGRYRTPLKALKPGSHFTSTLANSEPNWNMRIKSVIFAPLEGEAVSTGATTINGVAWNDGTAKIEKVEVSTDNGQTWQQAELKPANPYAWHHWSLTAKLPAGKATILSRATDAQGRTQPLDGTTAWNPAGYAWNGVDSVTVAVK